MKLLNAVRGATYEQLSQTRTERVGKYLGRKAKSATLGNAKSVGRGAKQVAKGIKLFASAIKEGWQE